jgi:hypothetical protein
LTLLCAQSSDTGGLKGVGPSAICAAVKTLWDNWCLNASVVTLTAEAAAGPPPAKASKKNHTATQQFLDTVKDATDAGQAALQFVVAICVNLWPGDSAVCVCARFFSFSFLRWW